MANNVAITAGAGTSVATDDVGGVHYQVVKLATGIEDSDERLGHNEDVAHATGDAGIMALAVRADTAAATGADGDYVPLLVDSTGRLWVQNAALDAIKTAVEVIDNAISGSEMQVDIVSGTVALSGEDHIGQLGGHTVVIKPTVTISTSAYAVGDSLAGEITLTSAMRTSGGSGVLTDIVLTDDDAEGSSMTVLIFDADPASTSGANDAFAWGAGDQAKLIGVVQIATGDWITLDSAKIVQKTGLGIGVKAVGSANLFAHIIINEIKTFTAATDVAAAFKFLQD